MLRLYRFLTESISGFVARHSDFIFTRLARILALACFALAILLCHRCTTQISL